MSHLLKLLSLCFLLLCFPALATEVELDGKKISIQVIEGETDQGQYVFAFFPDKSRRPIKGFPDEGGSPVKIIDIFTAVFDKSQGPMLAILTEWDSRSAGGNKVMERSGLFYEVHAFELKNNSFFEYKSKTVDKFRSCDCLLFTVPDNGEPKRTGKEKAFAKTKAEVLKRLQSM